MHPHANGDDLAGLPRLPDLEVGPASPTHDGDRAEALEDLAPGDLGDEVMGGSATYVKTAQGESRHRDFGNLSRPAPIARHASSGVLQKLAAQAAKQQATRVAGPKALTATRWLVADPKREGTWKRADEAVEGGRLRLEATVNPARAPDGTKVGFTVLLEGEAGADHEVAQLEGTVDGGAATVEWTCDPAGAPRGVDPKVSFKASCKDEQLRSALLPLRSFVAFVIEGPDGKPIAAPFAAKLTTGRERRGQSDAGGAPTRLPCPPGEVEVEVEGYERAAGLDVVVVDDAGAPVPCGYKVRFEDGREVAGQTGPDGRIAAEGAGAYELTLLAPGG